MTRALLTFWAAVLPVALPLSLGGCSATPKLEPIVKTVTVTLPGELRSCIPADLRGAPSYPDEDAALKGLAGPDERYQTVIAGRALRIARNNELETAVAGCR